MFTMGSVETTLEHNTNEARLKTDVERSRLADPDTKTRRASPLRTERRKQSWGRSPRSRGRARIGGTDRCTSAAARAWAPSSRLPWFSVAKHSAAFIQKTQVHALNKESKHHQRAGSVSWPPARLHDTWQPTIHYTLPRRRWRCCLSPHRLLSPPGGPEQAPWCVSCKYKTPTDRKKNRFVNP